MGVRVAVDIGGTFTDLVGLDERAGDLILAKVPTTPINLAEGVLDCLRRTPLEMSEVMYFVHGSTVVINTILQRKGVKTALLTTKGFRDVMEIQRGNRPDVYNFDYQKPESLVPRHLRFEVDERVDSQGRVRRELKKRDVVEVASKCKRHGVRSIAVCLINSYSNPMHEVKCAELIKSVDPEVSVTISSDLTREWREYERTSTTVMNAYIQPVVKEYLSSMEGGLNKLGLVAKKHIMQSNGGIISFDEARSIPLQMVESGPVGGIIAAAWVSKAIGEKNIITLDIGGTTAKTTLIDNGTIKTTDQYEVEATRFYSGYPLKIPVVDIVEIGAGGGSIAWVDAGGSVHVGPQSAGASPGPACYGKGGTEPTVTDASVLLGRINPDYFLGGEMRLDKQRAVDSVSKICKKLDTELVPTALGILRIVNNNMVNAIKLVSVRRGYDPRDFTLVAFGGLGACHASSLANDLRIRRVVIPKSPSHFCALGMIIADMQKHFVRTRVTSLEESSIDVLNRLFSDMKRDALKTYEKKRLELGRSYSILQLDMRYVGQEHTIRAKIPDRRITREGLRKIEDEFHKLHEFTYGFMMEEPIEIVSLRLIAGTRTKKPKLGRMHKKGKVNDARKGSRKVWFGEDDPLETEIYERELLPMRCVLQGPAIIEEQASTTVLYPGQKLTIDDHANLIVQVVHGEG